VVVWFHGVHRRFSLPEYVAIGRALAARGFQFISANTRGHDFGTWLRTDHGAMLAGSAWEAFSESPLDVSAWFDFAARHGDRLMPVGHGQGGAKLVYYQSERQDPRVIGMTIASSGSLFRDKINEDLGEMAQAMVAEGRGKDLLPWGSRSSRQVAAISASAYIDLRKSQELLYGVNSVPPALARIRCPLLAWYGTRERFADKDIDDFLLRVRRTATASALVRTKKLPNVDYFYEGKESVVANEVAKWCVELLELVETA
jgi:hypothetical protein